MIRFLLVPFVLAACLEDPDPVVVLLDATPTEACDPNAPQNECCELEDTEAAHMCVAAQAIEGTCISVRCERACEIIRLHGCNL